MQPEFEPDFRIRIDINIGLTPVAAAILATIAQSVGARSYAVAAEPEPQSMTVEEVLARNRGGRYAAEAAARTDGQVEPEPEAPKRKRGRPRKDATAPAPQAPEVEPRGEVAQDQVTTPDDEVQGMGTVPDYDEATGLKTNGQDDTDDLLGAEVETTPSEQDVLRAAQSFIAEHGKEPFRRLLDKFGINSALSIPAGKRAEFIDRLKAL